MVQVFNTEKKLYYHFNTTINIREVLGRLTPQTTQRSINRCKDKKIKKINNWEFRAKRPENITFSLQINLTSLVSSKKGAWRFRISWLLVNTHFLIIPKSSIIVSRYYYFQKGTKHQHNCVKTKSWVLHGKGCPYKDEIEGYV